MKKISQLALPAIALALFVVGCTKAVSTANYDNGSSSTIPTATPATPLPQGSANSEDKMPRVKAQDAMKEVADGKAIIIDVRGTEAYKMAHIKGALDFPLQKIEGKDFNGLPKDKLIIAYCT